MNEPIDSASSKFLRAPVADTALRDEHTEKLILAELLNNPAKWPETSDLSIEDFKGYHQDIYEAMNRLAEDGKGPGLADVHAELIRGGKDGAAAYAEDIYYGAVGGANLKPHVAHLRETTKRRTACLRAEMCKQYAKRAVLRLNWQAGIWKRLNYSNKTVGMIGVACSTHTKKP